jgi:hypothetical protein
VKKIVFALVILTVSALLAMSCESLTGGLGGAAPTLGGGETATIPETTPDSAPAGDMAAVAGTEANFGQALDFGGLVIRVDAPFEDSGATPTPGNRAWAALVTLQNNRSTEAMYGPLDFHFVDGAGADYEALGASNLQMMSNGILSPGQQAQAYIVMQLPSSTTPAQIRFQPYIPSDEKWIGIWR